MKKKEKKETLKSFNLVQLTKDEQKVVVGGIHETNQAIIQNLK